jgi:hypothetical protein
MARQLGKAEMMLGDPFFDATAALRAWPDRVAVQQFQGKWTEKHWMNTPGPIYCGDCDNSGTGPPQASNNVRVDAQGFPVIFRQPANYYELRQVLHAAYADPFSAYAMDGDARWSYPAVRAWWREKRPAIEQEIERMRLAVVNSDPLATIGVERWLDYYRDGLREYLRAYAFFLEAGRAAVVGDALPEM